MTGTARVVRADARSLPMGDASVDLVITSPPYFSLRSYQDEGAHYGGQIGAEATPAEYVDSLLAVTREAMRVLKPSGSLWVNLGDKYQGNDCGCDGTACLPTKTLMGLPWRYALRCVDELGLILRAEVIWAKPNGLPEPVTDRVRRSHEQWFHFTLAPRYFANIDPIREKPADYTRKGGRAAYTANGAASHGIGSRSLHQMNPEGALPLSVWTVPTEPLNVPDHLGVDHFAAFPTEWPRKIISAWCPEGGTVLDPFGGTGTTAMVAKALGRHGISVDMSADYCRLAQWRTNDRNQLAKVLGMAKTDAPDPYQLDLFGGTDAA